MVSKLNNNHELFEKQDPARYGDVRGQSLFIPRVLRGKASDQRLRGEEWRQAHETIKRWANLDTSGKLQLKKETALQGEFLTEVFGQALGYTLFSKDKDHWNLEPQFRVNDETADAALGVFEAGKTIAPTVLIELKGPTVNLDRDRSKGRTPVQQLWDYLSEQPECPWGIACNYVSFRLYHRNRTRRTYQHFVLKDFVDEEKFAEFYCVLAKEGLLPPATGPSRSEILLRESEEQQQKVGDDLYAMYDSKRRELVRHLKLPPHSKTLEQALHIAQKLIDRIIFVAFCEDRELLPNNSIHKAYSQLQPFSQVTNPQWQNFLGLFRAIDTGSARDGIPAFNGNLFKKDDEVDDLQLDDGWTDFFDTIGNYDFRDEVNVEVLGHLFEKSVSDVGRIRLGGGLFDEGTTPETQPKMSKVAERKRFGIYYTPPEFTGFIVNRVVVATAEHRFRERAKELGLTYDEKGTARPDSERAEFWRGCLGILRSLKVVDPACGSGAFLISAYDALESLYHDVVFQISYHSNSRQDTLQDQVADFILHDNLHGVDLSPQAVEITQLSLWIRSAQKGKTLADLSKNIICGNSLISDLAVDPIAVEWQTKFPSIFERSERGFDCVIGNPPWERMKLQEREYFDNIDNRISTAVNAAERRRLIAELENERPEVHDRYLEAKAAVDQSLDYVRNSGRYPLTGKGDINTYAVFAELASQIVSARGKVGLLLPSGIATDDTTKEFFGQISSAKSLSAVYDFENRNKVFPDVDGRFKFSVFLFGGDENESDKMDFVFFAHKMDDLRDKSRHVELSAADIALVNPNTKTLPIFRSQQDAELTKAIYKRVPVLVDENRREGGNPWGVRFLRMFDQTNDAGLFKTADELKADGFKRQGPVWKKGKAVFLPLYEAKMVQMYDHRAASVVMKIDNWFRQGQTQKTTPVLHQNPEFCTISRWWVAREEVTAALDGEIPPALLAFKNVTSPTNQRTMIAAFLPFAGVVNSAPIMMVSRDIGFRVAACLLGNLNSVALDSVARQKVGNVNLNFFLIEQLPIFPPQTYEDHCPWSSRTTLEKWVSDRVLKLTCTSNDMIPLAEACDFDPPVHPWKEQERAELLAELDAAYFILYGIGRDDVEYILSTFQGISQEEEGMFGSTGTRARILKHYDHLISRM